VFLFLSTNWDIFRCPLCGSPGREILPRFSSSTGDFYPTEKGWVFKLFFYRRIEDGKLEWGPVLEKTLKKIPRKPTETEFTVALIPLGGYVKMAGTIDESLDDEITGAPDELTSKSRLQQAWVMSAGVIMNLILAVLVYTGVSWSQGVDVPINDEPVVGVVVETLLQINPETGKPIINPETDKPWDPHLKQASDRATESLQ
jgi:hypothetical protein